MKAIGNFNEISQKVTVLTKIGICEVLSIAAQSDERDGCRLKVGTDFGELSRVVADSTNFAFLDRNGDLSLFERLWG